MNYTADQAERNLQRIEATQELAKALVAAESAGVIVTYISDDPANPHVTISIRKLAGEQFLIWEPDYDSSGRASTYRRLRLAT